MKKSTHTVELLWPLLLVGALLVIWQGIALLGSIPRWILPGPYDIVIALRNQPDCSFNIPVTPSSKRGLASVSVPCWGWSWPC